MNIAQTLDICLKKRGLSKTELAKRADLSKSYLSRIANNERIPNLETLEKICTALQIPLSVFIFISNNDIDNISSPLKEKINNIFLELLDDNNDSLPL
ncbi:helix-turn-helix transcriptional regulator [Morganella morganii subsp. sibonii]